MIRLIRSLRTLALAAVLVGAVVAPRPLAAQEGGAAPAREQAAQRAAEAWLALMDQGKYAESWQAAGSLFRQAVTAERWAQQVAAVVAQVGAFQRRELQKTEFTTELPNGPQGEYMVLTYSSAFANLPNAREVVILQLEDGEWKTIGYLVQPGQG